MGPNVVVETFCISCDVYNIFWMMICVCVCVCVIIHK